jgi:hypothetical protein
MQHEGVYGLRRPESRTYGAGAAQSTQRRCYIRNIFLKACEQRGHVLSDTIRQNRPHFVSGHVATVGLS